MSDEMSDEMTGEKTSLAVLADAFAELERRADRVTSEVAFAPPRLGRRRRWPVVAAAAAGVAAVATGAALLAEASGPSPRPAAAGSPTVGKPSVTSSSPSAGRDRVPTSAREIARRFRAALDDALSSSQVRCSQSSGRSGCDFSVTGTGHAVTVQLPIGVSHSARSHSGAGGKHATPSIQGSSVKLPNGSQNGAAIRGQLTVGGVTGGYDVQMLDAHGAKASCDTPTHCSTKVFADGTTLAVGQDALEGGGVTYVADVVRSDGVEVLMHVSNRKDAKGAGAVRAVHPPLSPAQLRAVVMSDRW